MPKDTSIKTILTIGSGPIIIGQGCEFDYSGVQACKALREEGYRVVLVNSNPATIMTDPDFADATYIEPITPEAVEKIIQKEKPDALLPTLGGQTGLNCAMELHRAGTLEKYGVQMIGARADAIEKGENREIFKQAMLKIGLDCARSGTAHSLEEALQVAEDIGNYPLIIRPAYTLGGSGGGIAYNREEFEHIVSNGLDLSPVTEILVEESMLGWKEYEMEVMRDRNDNCVVICAIENFDPMGIHTGDSITVAPAMTLTDREYQEMRDQSFAVIREVGVETGGSNIQFAVNPQNGRMVVIEMNPRVSRSSALASKATGFPIAKFAAKLAVGYTLDEIRNDITRETPASFEPTIDYVVTKCPRFTFEKFKAANTTLTTAMKSVGETMAIGRTFKQSLQKALRGLETGRGGLLADGKTLGTDQTTGEDLRRHIATPTAERIFWVAEGLRQGISEQEIHELSAIDPWFIAQLNQIVQEAQDIPNHKFDPQAPEESIAKMRRWKKMGFSDRQLAHLHNTTEDEIRQGRHHHGVLPTYRLVDTCAAEFEAYTPYYYSTYGDENEAPRTDKKKILILGGGPNRIGQGIEFDYCCVHASFALSDMGYETIMVNSNPETVSTDYDTSDRLYFEPLTLEDVLEICRNEQPDGVIVQFGGQTPLNLAADLKKNGVPIIGTSPESIDLAEDRKHFSALLDRLELKQAEAGTAVSEQQAADIAARIGYPVLVRPSFVLGGRAMMIVHEEKELRRYMNEAVDVSPDKPVLVDRFLDGATEVDVDALSDGDETIVGAIMEHIEQAGVHSGDSACVIPPHSLSEDIQERITTAAKALAKELNVIGLMNIQFAVKDNELYIIEVNPRASRTVPFVSKAIGVPLAKLAAQVMAGKTIAQLKQEDQLPEKIAKPQHYSVKEAVFPWAKFPGMDIVLGPEMRATGEVMGIDPHPGLAYAKSQLAASNPLPTEGTVFISVCDRDKQAIQPIARDLVDLGFNIIATGGTAKALNDANIPAERVKKVLEGRPNIVDKIKNGEIAFILNTPSNHAAREDEIAIRTAAIQYRTSHCTHLPSALATLEAIKALKTQDMQVQPIQSYHAHPPH